MQRQAKKNKKKTSSKLLVPVIVDFLLPVMAGYLHEYVLHCKWTNNAHIMSPVNSLPLINYQC
jgi:multidrug resistance efflux pump